MINIKANSKYINEYKKIIQTTDIQLGYKELINSIKHLKSYLQKEMKNFIFSKNIVENNLEYTYFHFTNKELKSHGLKLVLVFTHKEFKFEIFLSGVNRQKQINFFNDIKDKKIKYILSNNPSKTDYVLKYEINDNFNYETLEEISIDIYSDIKEFTKYILLLLENIK